MVFIYARTKAGRKPAFLVNNRKKTDMKYQKGKSGNPGGRPPGSRNKATKTLRTLVNDFLKENWNEFEQSYQLLTPREKVTMFERMLKFGLPSLQAISIAEELEAQLKSLTDQDLNELINRLLDHYNTKKNG